MRLGHFIELMNVDECYILKKNSSYYLLSTYYVLDAYLGSFFPQGVQLNIQPQTTTGAGGRSISSDSIMKWLKGQVLG